MRGDAFSAWIARFDRSERMTQALDGVRDFSNSAVNPSADDRVVDMFDESDERTPRFVVVDSSDDQQPQSRGTYQTECELIAVAATHPHASLILDAAVFEITDGAKRYISTGVSEVVITLQLYLGDDDVTRSADNRFWVKRGTAKLVYFLGIEQ